MLTLRARWVLPIAGPPLDEGWVAVADGRVAAVGRERRRSVRPGAADVDLGRVALLPGLVNAHTHLELSYLAGAVPPAGRFTDWIRQVMALRREQPDPAAPAIIDPMRGAISALTRQGTALVGDVSNTLVSVPALGDAGQHATVFHELIRLRAADAESVCAAARDRIAALAIPPHVRVSLAPHAPYRSLRGSSRPSAGSATGTCARARRCTSRSPPRKTELLEQGTGPWRRLLGNLGAWDDEWTAPGCGAVEYMERMGLLDDRLLAVHAVQCSPRDLGRLAARRATVVTCPRSNRHVGVGMPPLPRSMRRGSPSPSAPIVSRAQPDLSVWPELAELRRLAPEVPAGRLLESATRTGAEALGFGSEFGTIEPGKRAALVAVSIPPAAGGAAEVEERPRERNRRDTAPLGRGHRLMMWTQVRTYASFVRFSHSVFALPFALTGALLAVARRAGQLGAGGWIIVAMVGGPQRRDGIQPAGRRRVGRAEPADGDARDSPRRHDPRGGSALRRGGVGRVRAAAPRLGRCAWRSRRSPSPSSSGIAREALHDLHAGVPGPGHGGRARRRVAGGRGTRRGEPWLLGLAIGLWVGGFDVLYACQDLEFDRAHGLRSIPVRFGVARSLAISRAMHVSRSSAMAALGVVAQLGRSTSVAWRPSPRCSCTSSRSCGDDDLSQVKRAFDLNGYVGMLYFAVTTTAVFLR